MNRGIRPWDICSHCRRGQRSHRRRQRNCFFHQINSLVVMKFCGPHYWQDRRSYPHRPLLATVCFCDITIYQGIPILGIKSKKSFSCKIYLCWYATTHGAIFSQFSGEIHARGIVTLLCWPADIFGNTSPFFAFMI